MCEGPLFKKMLFYTVPIILASVLQLLFNAADLVVVGRFCGSISVAAVGGTGAIINLTVSLFVGLSMGAGVVVAQSIGARSKAAVQDAVHTAIPLAAVGGVILTFVGVFGARTFLRLMGTPNDVIALSTTYMRIYFCGVISLMLYNFGSAILRAVGDTKSPLIYLTAAGILNVILNIIFVKYFNLNVAGVALATTISQTLSAAMVIINLLRRTDDCRLSLKKLRFTAKTVSRILRIGLPSGIQSAMFSVSNVLIQSSINSLGSVVMSGSAASSNIEGFIFISMNAYHQTSVNFVGQNVGARRFDRVKRITWLSVLMVSVTGVVLSTLTLIFAKPLLSIYIVDSNDAINYGITRLGIFAAVYFTCGIMDVLTGAMRGMGASTVPMLISVFGVCGIRILWIYTAFRANHTLECICYSYPISWIITVAVDFAAFFLIKRRLQKRLNYLDTAEHVLE